MKNIQDHSQTRSDGPWVSLGRWLSVGPRFGGPVRQLSRATPGPTLKIIDFHESFKSMASKK